MAAKKTKKRTARKKTSKRTGAKTSAGANALDFCRDYLKRKPGAAFAEIRDAAEKKGLKLYPISFGRAQALEGIVKARPYGLAKKAKAAAPAKRGPGRPKGSKNKPRAGAASASMDGLDGLVAMLKNLERERDAAVRMLDRIRELVS